MSWLARAGADETAMRTWWLTGVAVMGVLLLWRWTRRDGDVDADWLATMSSSLLASPLGWSYYAPFLLAPFVGRRSAWRWVGYGCFAFPLALVSWGQLSAVGGRESVV